MVRRAGPALVLAACWALTAGGVFGHVEVNDLFVYGVLNELLDAGQVPYRDFGFEYPPLAAPAIYVPWLVGGEYALWLAVWMLGFWLVAQELVRRLGGEGAAWLMAVSPIVCGALVRTHFDAVPVAVCLGALVALTRGRGALGFVLLAVGGLVKLFPLVLVAAAALWTRSVRGPALAALVVLAGIGPFVAMGGFDFMVRFHLERPVQLESTPATLVFAFADPVVTNTTANPDRFKSNGLDDPLADVLQPVFTVLLLGVLGGIALAAGRRPGDDDHLLRAAFASVLAFVALGKVLSPQYVMWLYPFACVAWFRGDRVAAGLTIAACALTQAWFPTGYFDLVNEDAAMLLWVALRNTLLVAALVAILVPFARVART